MGERAMREERETEFFSATVDEFAMRVMHARKREPRGTESGIVQVLIKDYAGSIWRNSRVIVPP